MRRIIEIMILWGFILQSHRENDDFVILFSYALISLALCLSVEILMFNYKNKFGQIVILAFYFILCLINHNFTWFLPLMLYSSVTGFGLYGMVLLLLLGIDGFYRELNLVIASGLALILNPYRVWEREYLQYGLNLAVYIITIMGLTFFLTNLIRNKNGMSAVSNVIALGSSFISGVFIPRDILSASVIGVAKFFPACYYVSANESIFIHTDQWILNMAIQLLFGLVFFLVGIYIAKVYQREQALEW